MVSLDEVKDGDLGLAPREQVLDNVSSDEPTAADDEAGAEQQNMSARVHLQVYLTRLLTMILCLLSESTWCLMVAGDRTGTRELLLSPRSEGRARNGAD